MLDSLYYVPPTSPDYILRNYFVTDFTKCVLSQADTLLPPSSRPLLNVQRATAGESIFVQELEIKEFSLSSSINKLQREAEEEKNSV